MTSFNPDGFLVVAFENGIVRTWNLLYRADAKKKFEPLKQNYNFTKAGGRNRGVPRYCIDLADVGYLQFNTYDILDMNSPHRQGTREFDDDEVSKLNLTDCIF